MSSEEVTVTFRCADCEDLTEVPYGEEETNDDDDLLCEECAAPMQWEDQDFPLWVRYESYDDTFGLERSMSNQIDVPREDIPEHIYESGSDFKYTVFHVWFKVDEDGNVEGPYDEKRGRKI